MSLRQYCQNNTFKKLTFVNLVNKQILRSAEKF